MTHINWCGYYSDNDGYGRFNSRMIWALRNAGVQVSYFTKYHLGMPGWMQKELGIDWNDLTISCAPAVELAKVPGKHWLITMIESNCVDHDWLVHLCTKDLERILVPCLENRNAFENAGVNIPIEILHGGTDPKEFPWVEGDGNRPYTFLALTDRGFRKGWSEVWEAFYKAFGGKTTGIQDVRLILKYLPHTALKETMSAMSGADGADKRIIYQSESAKSMWDVFYQVDCVVLPSHFEGWGMPHREAAMAGLPVITQKYSGMDDGFTEKWALTVPGREMTLGWWQIPDIDAIAEKMKWCFYNREEASRFGKSASLWLQENQTWDHSAARLLEMMEEQGYAASSKMEVERPSRRMVEAGFARNLHPQSL